jgi:hypothetical protein
MDYVVDVRKLERFNEMGGWLDEEVAFVVDSHIVASDAGVEVTVYPFPQLADLVQLIQNIDLSTDVRTDSAACDII